MIVCERSHSGWWAHNIHKDIMARLKGNDDRGLFGCPDSNGMMRSKLNIYASFFRHSGAAKLVENTVSMYHLVKSLHGVNQSKRLNIFKHGWQLWQLSFWVVKFTLISVEYLSPEKNSHPSVSCYTPHCSHQMVWKFVYLQTSGTRIRRHHRKFQLVWMNTWHESGDLWL